MCVCTSISVSLRFSLFSISCPCSLRKVQRNRLRFWMKFCSSSLPFAYANRILVFKGSIFNTNKEESIRLAQKQLVYGNLLWFALEKKIPVWAASWSEWRDWRTAPRTGWHWLLLSQSSTSALRCETSAHLKTTDQPKRGEGPTINHCFVSVESLQLLLHDYVIIQFHCKTNKYICYKSIYYTIIWNGWFWLVKWCMLKSNILVF